MSGCRFPEHHKASGGGFPWGLVVIVAGVVLLGSSAAFARVVHDVMYLVLGVCALVVVAGLGGLGLVLHHQRAIRRPGPSVVLHLDARMNRRDEITGPRPAIRAAYRYDDTGRPAVSGRVVERPAVSGRVVERAPRPRQIGGR